MYKVSIIVPVFNSEKYLEKCINSLVNQTLKDIEIILVNDCSTDSSGDICDDYAKNDSRIRVIHNEKNIRQGLSRNKGIDIAKGEYVGFIDSDDWVDIDFYEKLYNSAKNKNSDIAKAESIYVYPDGKVKIRSMLNSIIQKEIKKGDPLFLSFNCDHCTAIYRKDALLKDKIYYPDIHNAQDWAFLFVATYFMSNISFVYGTFYYYRQCLNTTSTTRNKAYYNGVLDAYRFIIENLNKFDVEKKIYDKAFFSFSEIPISKLSEIGKSKEFENLEKEYLNSLEEIIGTYKYLNFDSLLLFYKRIFELNRLEKSISYRIGRIFTWLPRKIKTCFHNKKNLW